MKCYLSLCNYPNDNLIHLLQKQLFKVDDEWDA